MAAGTSPTSFLQWENYRMVCCKARFQLLSFVSVLWCLQKTATLVTSLLCQGEEKVKKAGHRLALGTFCLMSWLLQGSPLPILGGLCHKLNA